MLHILSTESILCVFYFFNLAEIQWYSPEVRICLHLYFLGRVLISRNQSPWSTTNSRMLGTAQIWLWLRREHKKELQSSKNEARIWRVNMVFVSNATIWILFMHFEGSVYLHSTMLKCTLEILFAWKCCRLRNHGSAELPKHLGKFSILSWSTFFFSFLAPSALKKWLPVLWDLLLTGWKIIKRLLKTVKPGLFEEHRVMHLSETSSGIRYRFSHLIINLEASPRFWRVSSRLSCIFCSSPTTYSVALVCVFAVYKCDKCNFYFLFYRCKIEKCGVHLFSPHFDSTLCEAMT